MRVDEPTDEAKARKNAMGIRVDTEHLENRVRITLHLIISS
jgi:hypothetical protein